MYCNLGDEDKFKSLFRKIQDLKISELIEKNILERRDLLKQIFVLKDVDKNVINDLYLNKSKNMINKLIKKIVEGFEKMISKNIKKSKFIQKIVEMIQDKIWNNDKKIFLIFSINN